MLPATLLAKKRDGGELAWDEIRFLIDGFVAGRVTDYQMSAFAMAVAIRGMTPNETAALTLAMLDSGERLEVVDSHGEVVKHGRSDRPRVDKHSTGGLGDKVSLILAPLMACHGVHVPRVFGSVDFRGWAPLHCGVRPVLINFGAACLFLSCFCLCSCLCLLTWRHSWV